MPQIQLNQNKQWLVNNFDDFHGNIVDAVQLDLQKKYALDPARGNLTPGGKLYPHTTQATVTSINTIDSFIFTDADGSGLFWANANAGKLFKTSGPFITDAFIQETATSAPTVTFGDMAVFGTNAGTDRLIVPTTTTLAMLSNGTWDSNWWGSTLGQASLVSTYAHNLAVFRQPYLLIIGDKNAIHTIDQVNNVVYNRLVLPAFNIIRWVRCTESRVYIGVSDTRSAPPGVYEYDPVNETAYFYSLDTPGSMPGAPLIDGNTLLVLTNYGRLKYFTGSGFEILSETPFSKRLTQPITIHRNCAFTQNNQYFFNLPGSTGQTADTMGAWAGMYVYDKADKNFYHKYAVTFGIGDSGQLIVGSANAAYSNGVSILASINDYLAGTPSGIYVNSNIHSTTTVFRTLITSPKIPSQSLKDVWRALWLKYYFSGSDAIRVWCRNSYASAILPSETAPAAGAWTANNTVTSTDTGVQTAASGNQFMAVAGRGSGRISKVTSVSTSGGVTTLVIEDTFGSASQSLYFVVTNFKQLTPVTSAVSYSNFPVIDAINAGTWIQFQLELQGQTPIVEDVLVEFSNDQVIT